MKYCVSIQNLWASWSITGKHKKGIWQFAGDIIMRYFCLIIGWLVGIYANDANVRVYTCIGIWVCKHCKSIKKSDKE